MDEPYRIEVLHIVNPHVMYIESQAQKGIPVIEQVGIYGALPVNKTIDIDGQVVAERCENWPVAANAILRDFLADHKNCVYFVPIQVDERSTIFDENIHRFGDIIVKAGKRISVTDHLVELSVAVRDEAAFHQKLASGSLKTKLNTVRTEEVINAIKKYYQKQKKVEHDWQKTINKQTTLYQETKKVTADLTETNLKLFERNSYCMENVMETIERKEKDLNLCKDADMVSVGCGVRRNKVNRDSSTISFKQSLDQEAKNEYSPHDVLKDVKKYLEANCRTKDSSGYKNFEHNSKNSKPKQSTPRKENNENKDMKQLCCSEDEENHAQQKYYGQDKIQMRPYPKYNNQDEQQEKPSHYDDQDQKHNRHDHENSRQRTNSGKERNNDRNHSRNYHGSKNRRSATEVFDKSYKQKMNSSQYEEKRASQHHGSTKRAPVKTRERRLVFCPDMELSADNLKTLMPVTVLEDCVMEYSKTATQLTEAEDNNVFSNDNILDKNTLENNETYPQIPQSAIQNSTQISSAKIRNEESQLVSSILKRKLQVLKDAQKRQERSFSSNSDTSVKDTSSSTEQSKIEQELLKVKSEPLNTDLESLKIESELPKIELAQPKLAVNVHKTERNVNPFKNLDGSKSVFVDKLISPILMVHTKNDNLILPQCDLRDIPFKPDIHCMLKNMRIKKPKRLQTVSWSYILRGHSVFMIAPSNNGKTLGYIPAVCNLVTDSRPEVEGVGPICVIICATALSVSEIESHCKRFLSLEKRIVTFFPGVDYTKATTALLNGCHIVICTAPAMVNLLEVDFGVDLRRLMILVFDDCERLSQVYASELNKILHNVTSTIKNRADKSLKVQYVVASRQWCDFMTPVAKKAPDTVIAIGASQECVLYSKTKTSVNFVKSQDSKINSVIEFLDEIDRTKRTVIVCREDDEVVLLDKTLTALKHTVFTCNSTMTVHDLYNLNEAWAHYREPVLGPILICCDGNLTHLNITNANYLVHFSMPALFSMFCKRFSVLNENYASIFGQEKDDVKIKILLDETNVEQLPKILHFVKRCTKESFPMLDNVLKEVMELKDLKKAENLSPICNNLLMLGECIDVWNCSDRHMVFKEFDEPEDWIPKQGVITFKILHYDSAVTYSARVLAKTTKSGVIKYPNNYNTLSLKMGMYYSKEINRKLHGIPKAGDVCAVALKQNFFERCKVLRVIPSDIKNSYHVLINLIDEEQLTVTKDVHLFYLPDDLKAIQTHVVKVRLANIQPKDKDITFSLAAKDLLQKTTDRDRNNILYMKGQVVMTLGNCIFVDTAEACIDLSSVGETVVKRDFKKELLSRHAEPNPEHIQKLKKIVGMVNIIEEHEPEIARKVPKSPKWAHLDKDDFSTVIFTAAVDAGTIFVRHSKFQKVLNLLLKDIKEYAEKTPEVKQEEIYVGNIVLAEFPDDKTYERARIDGIIDDRKVNCFFVDNGDWRQVSVEKIKPITENIMHYLPFQGIECRLVGVKPPGNADDWPEFSTNWLYDNCFEDNDGNTKYLYAKYFTKEIATETGGHKYGVVLIDTNSDQDVVVNKIMIELNLAKEIEDESKYINEPLSIKPLKATASSSDEEDASKVETSISDKGTSIIKDLVPLQSKDIYKKDESSLPINILLGKPIRSVPLVNDSDSDVSDKWDVNVDKDLLGMFGQPSKSNITEYKSDNKDATDEEKNISPEKLNETVKYESSKHINVDVATSNNNTKDTKNNVSGLLKTEESKGNLELTPKSPVLESQSDSDDFNIGNDRIEALNILKNKLFQNDVTEKSNNVGFLNRDINVENASEKYTVRSDKNETLDSDDLSSAATDQQISEVPKSMEAVEPPRKPKLLWRQNKDTVTVKINLIGVEDYVLEIKERYLRFQTWHNDTNYEFDFQLYGVIKPENSVHSNKGQYIQVRLVKLLHRSWLKLNRDYSTNKWIVYDFDAMDFSTDEDEDDNDEARKVIKHNHEKVESASEDEDFADDMNFRYEKY